MPTGNSSNAKRHMVSGAVSLTGAPGAGLPLIAHPNRPGRWLTPTVDELTGAVSGLAELIGEISGIVPVEGHSEIVVGESPPIIIITKLAGVPVRATVVSGDPALGQDLPIDTWPAGLQLQIEQQRGAAAGIRRTRSSVRRFLAAKIGQRSAEAFWDSCLQAEMWARLLKAARNEQARADFIVARSRLTARMTVNGAVEMSLTDLDLSGFDVDLAKLSLELAEEFSRFDDGATSPISAEEAQTVNGIISRIRSTGRQEERLAMLLSLALTDSSLARIVLHSYGTDRARLANHALSLLRDILSSNVSDAFVQAGVGRAIKRLVSDSFYMSVGTLLYYLAFHLSANPMMNSIIRDETVRRGSYIVSLWRDDILAQLDDRHLSQGRLP